MGGFNQIGGVHRVRPPNQVRIMRFIWRHYSNGKIINQGEVKAPCRVTAKRKVTIDFSNFHSHQRPRQRLSWREKVYYTIASISDMRGIRYPLSSESEFIVFFCPDNENGMLSDLTNPSDSQLRCEL